MNGQNLRHLRMLVAVAETGSFARAGERMGVSQPAVTQAVAKLERDWGGPLLDRAGPRVVPTARGAILTARLGRAFGLLDPVLRDLGPRLFPSSAQLSALEAVAETGNFTLAARRLNLAQPTVHRAVSTFEAAAGRPLFERVAHGIVASRPAQALAQAVRLATHELAQARAELAELDGGEAGTLVIGALPLARSVLLPHVLVAFRRLRPTQRVAVIDGRYDELLYGLRRGEIDLMVGALRLPSPIDDIRQETLFDDTLSILAGRHHPLAGASEATLDTLRGFPWVVPRRGTPTRAQFDALFGDGLPDGIIEASSILMMREILSRSDHLGCISRAQAQAELAHGLLAEVPTATRWEGRPIGITSRVGWIPTATQRLFLALLRDTATGAGVRPQSEVGSAGEPPYGSAD